MNWIATHYFGKPDNKSLTWWLVEKQYSLKAQLAGLIAYFAMFTALFQSRQSSLAFIISMYGHELGHYLQFRANKIKAVILLLWPIGAAALPINEQWNKKSDKLPWNNVAWLLLAGPAFNMFQMLIGLAFVKFGIFPEFFRNYVFINGMLGLFNLLPLGNFDGGQLFFVIFSSLNELKDRLTAGIASVAGFTILIWIISRHLELGLIGVAF